MFTNIEHINKLELDIQQLHLILTTRKNVDDELFRTHLAAFKQKSKQMNELLEMAKMEFNSASDSLLQYRTEINSRINSNS